MPPCFILLVHCFFTATSIHEAFSTSVFCVSQLTNQLTLCKHRVKKKQGLMLSGHGNLILHTDASLPKSFSRLATCPGCTPSVPVTAKICSCSSCSSEWDHQQSLFTNNRVFVAAIGAGNLCESETHMKHLDWSNKLLSLLGRNTWRWN